MIFDLFLFVIILYAQEIAEESISAKKEAIDLEKRIIIILQNRRTLFGHTSKIV